MWGTGWKGSGCRVFVSPSPQRSLTRSRRLSLWKRSRGGTRFPSTVYATGTEVGTGGPRRTVYESLLGARPLVRPSRPKTVDPVSSVWSPRSMGSTSFSVLPEPATLTRTSGGEPRTDTQPVPSSTLLIFPPIRRGSSSVLRSVGPTRTTLGPSTTGGPESPRGTLSRAGSSPGPSRTQVGTVEDREKPVISLYLPVGTTSWRTSRRS